MLLADLKLNAEPALRCQTDDVLWFHPHIGKSRSGFNVGHADIRAQV
jgi:hypothetical protein